MNFLVDKVKSTLFSANPIKTPVYDQRIDCFKKLMAIQQTLKHTEEETNTLGAFEGTAHKNAAAALEKYTKDYKLEYEKCEKVMKY
jgi:hypothetical protein